MRVRPIKKGVRDTLNRLIPLEGCEVKDLPYYRRLIKERAIEIVKHSPATAERIDDNDE